MKFRFLHFADVHLGFKQYGLSERADDFARAFLHTIQAAIDARVDFVLLAGDLFHKRSIDPLTLNQALTGLEQLKAAGIPCIAVEGNHELAPYDEALGWMNFLALRQALILLRAEFEGAAIRIAPYAKMRGSYVDIKPGVRIHGLRYHGAGVRSAIDLYADALQAHEATGVEYAVFMAHTGVEGVLAGDVGSPSLSHWSVIRPWTDYVALGHIHKPFDYQNWIYNPGSLESNSTDETEWNDRGYWLVDVDTHAARGHRHVAQLVAVPRRPFLRAAVKVDLLRSHEDVADECVRLLSYRAAELGRKPDAGGEPVVDLVLTGVLGFDSQTLAPKEIERRVAAATGALHVIVRNNTLTRGLAPPPNGDGLPRHELERQVVAAMFAGDKKYQDRSEAWADATLALKQTALAEAPPEAVLDELAALVRKVKTGPDTPAGSPASPADHG